MNYSDFVSTLQNLLVIPTGNTDFAQILPSIIADGENRIYRELDFLTTDTVDTSASFTVNSRSLTIPATTIIVNSINAITPASTQPSAGTRVLMQRLSVDYLNSIWPTASGAGATGVPAYFAMQSNTVAIVAPTPDATYIAEIYGIARPAPISSTNTTTWLATNLPDLFLAACMVFATAWQQNFGASGDNPQMPGTWESHYQALKMGAIEEEQRRKSQGQNWSPYSTTPLSTPRSA